MNRLMGAAILAAVVTFGSAAASRAETDTLAGNALREAVSGKTVYLRLSLGIELPISYRPNGTMAGKVNAVAAAFAGNEVRNDNGRWWIANDQLCQRWQHWMDGATYCYRLVRDGSNVRWHRNDGHNGTARIGG
jgi:hypothetical protein